MSNIFFGNDDIETSERNGKICNIYIVVY